METNKLQEILALHKLYLEGKPNGVRADLSGADLSGADLSGADLSGADLSWAYLSRADLSWANLSGANLYRANLSGANLSGANLSGANLSGANLSGADLSGAYYNPALVLSMANWGSVSDGLCKILMAYDAANHPNPKSFNEWKKYNKCPFNDIKELRAINFIQNRNLWTPSLLKKKLPSARAILMLLFKEKGIKT